MRDVKMDESDQLLIAAMVDGDEAAFHKFFDAYSQRIYRFAVPLLGGDPQAAEEVTQSTLLKAMRNLQKFRGEAALFSWLCQICRHQAIDYLRKDRRHTRHVVRIEDSSQLRAALVSIEVPATDEPLHCCETSEARKLVRSVLAWLPARYGDVLQWKYIEERSVADIGETLGIGYSAAESVLARARSAFRTALKAADSRPFKQ